MNFSSSPLSARAARDLHRMTDAIGGVPFSRREALRRSVYGSAGILLMEPLVVHAANPEAKPAAAKEGKARSVIQIWLWGGPCHIDTFDPKPEAGRAYTGALDEPIETNIKGVRVGQLLPELAKIADKYSLIRSMTHGNNGHRFERRVIPGGRRELDARGPS